MSIWRYRLAVLLTIAAVVLGGIGVVYANRPHDDDLAAMPTQTVAPPTGPVTLEEAYGSALSRARQWSATPVLVFASLQTDWPLDADAAASSAMPPGGWGRFGFLDGTGERDTLLSVIVQRYTNQVDKIDEQPWDGTPGATLPVAQTQVTSDAAFAMAEQIIGQRFRTQCPTARHQTYVTLIAGSPAAATATPASDVVRSGTPMTGTPAPAATASGTPATGGTPIAEATPIAGSSAFGWLVTYRDDGSPGINAISLTIDAATGAVVELQDNSVPCNAD